MKRQKVSQNSNKRPIGVFDSGVGGLTVVKELMHHLPNEDIVYFGDTARVPYGSKSKQTIVRFSVENALFLLRYNVKMIVVACNTASSVAIGVLRKNFKVPVIGVIAPGAIEAASLTSNKKVGVIGTSTTIRSSSYKKELLKSDSSIKVFSKSCPLFVPLAEEGWLNKKITTDIIKEYLSSFKSKGIDTLILGCTHYPLLKKAITKTMGKRIRLIDSAAATAKAIGKLLVQKNIATEAKSKAKLRFFISDEPDQFKSIGEKFLGRKLKHVKKADYGL